MRSALRLRGVQLRLGMAVLCLLPFAAALITTAPAVQNDLLNEYARPSALHPLGTGDNGVDLLFALWASSRRAFALGATVSGIATVVGVVLGLAAALFEAPIRSPIRHAPKRLLDALYAFPSLVLSMVLVAVLPRTTLTMVLALCALSWVPCAQLIHAETRTQLKHGHIKASYALGASRWFVLKTHVLRELVPHIIIQAVQLLSGAILAEASLSFLGLGAQSGVPGFGAIVDDGVAVLWYAPHVALCGGGAIFLCTAGLQLLADALLFVHRESSDSNAFR